MPEEISGVESTTVLKAERVSGFMQRADFRKLLALIILVGGGSYLWRHADPAAVAPYLYALISGAVGYYFGTTKSSQDKSDKIDDLTKKEVG
jgi:hypothetical protein